MPTNPEINKRIRELRLKLKLTQGDFAELINYGQGRISGIEKPGTSIPDKLIGMICAKTGASKKYILYGEGEMLPKEGEHPSDNDIPVKAIRLLTNILASKNEIYIKAMMSNLVAFDDALRSERGEKAEMPQGMVLIKDRRESGERRKNPDPDWPVEKELRQGGDRRKAGLG